MTQGMIPLTFDVEVPENLWASFVVLCQMQGEDPEAKIAEMCQVNMQLILEELGGIEDGVAIDPREEVYPEAVTALAQYLSVKHQLSLHQAQERAMEYLESL